MVAFPAARGEDQSPPDSLPPRAPRPRAVARPQTEPLKLPPSVRSPMNWRIGKPFQLLNSPVVNDDIRKRTVPKSAPSPPPAPLPPLLHQLCRSDARYVASAVASAAASTASSPRPFPTQYYCTTSVISYYFAVGRAILTYPQ